MLYFLMMLVCILVGSILVYDIRRKWKNPDDHVAHQIGWLLIIVGIFVIGFLVLFLPHSYMMDRQLIAEVTVAQQTLDNMRTGDYDGLEKAGVYKNIVELNQRISRERFRANHWTTRIFYIKEIETLELVE